jgi:hypothetical protein
MSWHLLRPSGRSIKKAPVFLAVMLATVVTASAMAVPPNNTSAPTINGTARDGQTLTATNGTWANSPTSFRYQWQRCSATGTDCAGIVSATNQSYTPVAADVDHRLRVVVTAINADGQSAANSGTTDVISGSDAPKASARPSISGSAIVGEELSATNGTWTGGATTFSFQWQRCDSLGGTCVNVTNATARSYGVRSADLGNRLRVEVTAKNANSSSSATSDTTAVVRTAGGGGTVTLNKAPTIRFISLRHFGKRVIARTRVCDDGAAPVTIVQRDLKLGLRTVTRRFSSRVQPCRVVTRDWTPPARFRDGRYTASLRAVDRAGKASRTVSRTIFFR